MKNRIYSKIDKAISKGHNLMYLYGDIDLLTDYFFYDIASGLVDIKETLKKYFLEINDFDYFVVYDSNNKFEFYNKKGIKLKLEDFIAKEKKEPSIRREKSNEKSNSKKEIDEATTNLDIFTNTISHIEKKSKNSKLGLYLEGFEYISNLYKDPDVTKISALENFYKLNNLITILSMKNPIERLDNFDIKLDAKALNLINISYPSKDEVFNTLVYKSLDKKIDFNLDLIDISENLASIKSSLKNTISIFDKIVEDNMNIKNISLSSFKGYLNKSIEEEVLLEDVILEDKIKNNLKSILKEFNNDNASNLKKGIILKGPPGTGKTFLVKALANEFNMFFSAPTLSDIKGEFIGESGANVKRLFEELRNNSPAILFLDELDSMFSSRGGRQTDSYTNDIVNQFLVEIDGVKTGKQKIFIIGATNRIEVIDRAIKSRLGEGIEIPLPNKRSREKIFNSKFKKFNVSDLEILREGLYNEFLDKTDGFSGRDIDNFVKELILIRSDEKFILEDINKVLDGKEKEYIEIFKKVMKDSIEEINVPEKVEIIGYEDIKGKLQSECMYIKSSVAEKNSMGDFGIDIEKGTILYGPPGNGKTELGSYIASKHGFYLIKILSKNFASISFEDTLNKLQEIFENTIKLSNITSKKGIVLFFDEIDTLMGDSLNPQVRGTLLDYLQDKRLRGRNSKIVFIGATNFYESLDEASIRAGRIDKKLQVNNPKLDDYIYFLLKFWRVDSKISLEIDHGSNIIKRLIDKFILQNFEEKKGIEHLFLVMSKYNTDIDDVRKKIKGFSEMNDSDKIKEIHKYNIQVYSISDIKNLAKKIKAFAYRENFISNKKIEIIDEVLEKFMMR